MRYIDFNSNILVNSIVFEFSDVCICLICFFEFCLFLNDIEEEFVMEILLE